MRERKTYVVMIQVHVLSKGIFELVDRQWPVSHHMYNKDKQIWTDWCGIERTVLKVAALSSSAPYVCSD